MISKPFQHKIPDSTPESLTEFDLLKLETDKLLQKGAIEQVESLEPGSFVSRLFTVPKSNGQRRPVINLRQLNKHVFNQKFRMESLGNIRSLLKQGGFMIKIDLQDAYMSVPVAPKSRSLLVFIFNGKIYHFKVMPFGLNFAPRIFTKLFKPILRLLRSQGMLLIIYLDDILLIAPTADLCLAQGKFLMKLLQDLGFLVNMNKSVLTPTQRIIFLGFLIDSVNMTISLPEEKQLAIIQKANSLLGQNLVSIRNLCQFVGMCSATRPALRQAPLFYRKIQLSINKVLSKAGLNKKLCYNQIIRLNFQVRQNLQWWAEEMPHHCSAPVFSPPVDVKIATDSSFLGWGATMGHARIAGLWEWEVGKAVVPHKQERTADLFHCSGIFCFPSKRHSCSAVSGQYCCCKLSESPGGDKVTSFVRSRNCNLGMVFTEKDLSFSNSHTRHCKQNPRWSVSSEARKHRMDVRFQCFSSDSGCLSAASSGSLCVSPQPSTPELFFLDPGSTGYGNRCFQHSMEIQSVLPVSSFSSHSEMYSENKTGSDRCIAHNASLEISTMVPSFNRNADGPTSTITPSCQITSSSNVPISSSPINRKESQSSRLACVGKSLKERGISGRVSKILLSSWRSSTEKHYQSAWKSFDSWCFGKSEDPISCPVNIVLEFLTDLFDKGLQYRTINTYRSAISMTHLPLDGSLIGSHPLVSRFMKGVFQSRPPCPRYLAT